jgi:hypothetical protein
MLLWDKLSSSIFLLLIDKNNPETSVRLVFDKSTYLIFGESVELNKLVKLHNEMPVFPFKTNVVKLLGFLNAPLSMYFIPQFDKFIFFGMYSSQLSVISKESSNIV